MGMPNLLAKFIYREPPVQPPTVRVVEDGLQVIRGVDVLASARWSDVKQIITYKHDLFSTDEIRVGFLAATEADSWLEISEEWSGFKEAIARMEELFPSIPGDWFWEVAVPAFDRKETVLWEDS